MFCTSVIAWSGYHYRRADVKWLIYLTNWSFSFVTLYFICATIVTAIHYKNQCKQQENTSRNQNGIANGVKMSATKGDQTKSLSTCQPRDNLVTTPDDGDCEVDLTGDVLEASRATPMSWFHRALWVIYNIAAVAGILVTLSFWTLIYASFGLRGPSAISVIFHAVNSIVMVGDTMLSSVPVRLFHFIYPMLYSVAYIVFTVIYWACGGTNSFGMPFIYPQTDYTGRPVYSAVSLVCLVLIALPLCHCLVFGLCCLRVWIKTKCRK